MQARELLLMLPETFLICNSWCHWPYSFCDMRATGKVSVCLAHCKNSISAPVELWRTSCQRKRHCCFYEPTALPGKGRSFLAWLSNNVLPCTSCCSFEMKCIENSQDCWKITSELWSDTSLAQEWQYFRPPLRVRVYIYILCAASIVCFVKHASLTLKTTLVHKEKGSESGQHCHGLPAIFIVRVMVLLVDT